MGRRVRAALDEVPPRWWGSGFAIVAFWLLGLWMFQSGRGKDLADGFLEEPFDLSIDLVVPLMVGLLFTMAAGREYGRGSATAARILLVLFTVVACGWTWFSAWGGFCLDPGEDRCVTPMASDAAHLLVPLGALAAGAMLELALRRRITRTTAERRAAEG
ncbi:MAG: hypothetical protein U0869_10250 [Chloroflexota bacterium]